MKTEIFDLRAGTLHMTLIKMNKAYRKRAHEKFAKVGLTEGQPKLKERKHKRKWKGYLI